MFRHVNGNIHIFQMEMNSYQIGKKIVTVNVSDLAAMGAEAIGIIVSMGLPKRHVTYRI